MSNRLSLFLGRKIKYNDVYIYSPTVNEIEQITENMYNIYLIFATFNTKSIFELYKQLNLINVDALDELGDYDDYDILTSTNFIVSQISDALSFFTKDNVFFDNKKNTFLVKRDDKDIIFITKDKYKDVVKLIQEVNCLNTKKEKELKFKNNTAKKMYEKLQEMRKKYRQNSELDFKDILSILCNAPDNGINIFNVSNLTIYQVCEHLERLSIKENYTRLLGVWQNGLLKNNNQLKDWMIKTKL